MDFYLVRHGDAKSEQEDPKRSLSDRGRIEVEKVARAAAAKDIKVSEILHSAKLRAKQTAEILASSLSPRSGVREIGGLSPQDDPFIIKAELEVAEEPLMLVGHLPHLGRLASLLVKGDPENEVVNFPPAAIVCLSHVKGAWEVKWTLTPEKL
jgi:phosphohistidine phosphatase